ncbi:ABC transporter substrate-binding protein [Alicycliphilus denitrificans]|uniref:Amino acid ABC transporter substrate-binding protein n=1 Tax=Alicycliphilus denitrificans TaxID=179636 RepID=A0A420K914_9BURK|nr:ABC transporter substrate-binding protein [Alicycliphilus denitrificans]RKJ95132.1 amino acid ABC transporter substrate-binding protein [Alicycliphilus denitrificans]
MQIFRNPVRALAACALIAGAATAAHAQDIPVVSIQSVTGPVGFAGAGYQKGIRLAIEEANARGGVHGRKINLIERDDGSDKGQAINLANQAIDRDRALMVLGPSATTTGVTVAPIFNDKKTVSLSFATSEAIFKPGPWMMKLQQSPATMSPRSAQYVLEKTPIRKVALVFDRTNEGLIEYKTYFRDPFKAGGGTIVAEEAVVGSDSNFMPLATKLKGMDLDAVYISTYGEQAANIILQLRQAGMPEKVRYIGSIAMVTQKFLTMTGAASEGSIAVSDYVAGIDRPLNKAFEANFKKRWGDAPDNWAASAYSLALVGLAAIEAAGPNPTREAVREAFHKIRDVPIVVGSGLWNHKDRIPDYGAVILTVKDGKFALAP